MQTTRFACLGTGRAAIGVAYGRDHCENHYQAKKLKPQGIDIAFEAFQE